MHFVIYVPGGTIRSDQQLAEIGLGSLGAGGSWWDAIQGPDGRRGLFCCWLKGDQFDPPQLQRAEDVCPQWDPAKVSDKYWIGYNPSQLPTAQQLAKREQQPGHWTRLGNGEDWKIPTLAMMTCGNRLGPDGKLQRTITDEYQEYSDRMLKHAAGLYEALDLAEFAGEGGGALTFRVEQAYFDAVLSLSLNYRLTAEVVDLLDLVFHDEDLKRVIMSALDIPVLLECVGQKKTYGPRVVIPVT